MFHGFKVNYDLSDYKQSTSECHHVVKMSLGSSSGRQLTCDKFPEVRHFKKDLQYNEEMDFDEMEPINKNE